MIFTSLPTWRVACVLLSAALASISTATSVRAQAAERTGMRGDSGMVIRTELDGPESALHDEAADVYLVSNVAGGPSAADGTGFISRIGPDGTVLDARWIDSGQDGVTLNAPKGLALSADTLFVADLDVVRRFHRETGESLGEWPVPGATFLNAVAVGPGRRGLRDGHGHRVRGRTGGAARYGRRIPLRAGRRAPHGGRRRRSRRTQRHRRR